MSALAINPTMKFQVRQKIQEGVVIEEIGGLIKVYKDGYIERPEIVPSVSSALDSGLGVTSRDIIIDKSTDIWARIYIPTTSYKLPLLIYFHGGGFCVGSANWSCYHEFLGRLSKEANCVIMSVNYRLAPENPLPAAYDDGVKALMWVKKHCLNGVGQWWSSKCNFSSIFLAGDSAGANIAHNVAIRVGKCPWIGSLSTCGSLNIGPLTLKGTILIQPFFGGELRTQSEKYMVQPPRSALTLTASDTYWRLALPRGANRDHPWCNPLGIKEPTKFEILKVLPTLVFIADMDILKDRNLELCAALKRAGKNVEHVVCNGVGHAFQILNKSEISQKRTVEMISHIKAFISR